MDQQYPGQAGGGQAPPEPGGYPGQPSYPDPGAQGQPYQPPQQPGYPPAGYEQGYAQGGYPPPPGAYPPAQKKPFNWLACCGISCGAMLLIGILVWVISLKTCGGFIGPLIQMGKVGQEVQKADASVVTASAQPVDAASLAAAPEAYQGQWLALEGALGDQSDPMAQEMASQSGQSGTAYYLEPNILVVDISGASAVGDEGDTVRAYGKAVKLDLKEMLKFLGPEAMKDLESDPQMQGKTTLVMFFAKEVELLASGESVDAGATEAGDGTAPPAGDEQKSGWE